MSTLMLASASGPKSDAATPGLSSIWRTEIWASSFEKAMPVTTWLSMISSSLQISVPGGWLACGSISSGLSKLERTKLGMLWTMPSSTERTWSALAVVPVPPRPSVVMRLGLGSMPWKPATTATSLRSLKRLMISLPSMSSIRAEAWASLVLIGICQTCQERAWMPMPWSVMASRPEVTCSPEATTASYSRAACIGEASVHQATNSLVLPDIAETTTATSWPASTSRFTWRATLRIRSLLATDVPPNFITRRLMTTRAFPLEDQYGDPRRTNALGDTDRAYT